MLKTCYNCNHYHTVDDSENSIWHWHDFCDQWGEILSGWNYYNPEIGETDGNGFIPVYDDFECGIAECYMFNACNEPFKPDEWFKANKQHNDELQKKYDELNSCPIDCPGNKDVDWCADNECPNEK